MTDLLNLIQSVGFPIAVCLYFIFKLEKTLENNTEALRQLKTSFDSYFGSKKPN